MASEDRFVRIMNSLTVETDDVGFEFTQRGCHIVRMAASSRCHESCIASLDSDLRVAANIYISYICYISVAISYI